MTGPLSGVRVIEACSALSGPFCGKLLGDMGAEVVKVEAPGRPDPVRVNEFPYDRHGHPDLTWRFLSYNTSKRDVAVDLKSEGGREVFLDLASDADAVVENMRPGAMEALGLGFEELREENPGLVYCSIKGFGREGPYRNRPAFDTLLQGMSGFATQVGEGTDPEMVRVYVVDMLTGLYAAWSVTMALYERREGSEGQRVDVSMLDATVSFLNHQLAEYTGARHHPEYEPRYEGKVEPNGFFETRDGHIGLLVIPQHWAGFCSAIERPGWAEDGHRYATNDDRVELRRELREDVEEALAERATAGWMDRFEAAEETVVAAPVNDVEGMVEDPQVNAQEAIVERDHPALGPYLTPNVVPRFSRTPGSLSDAPGMGEHTDAVLSELGYDPAEIEALRDEGAVE